MYNCMDKYVHLKVSNFFIHIKFITLSTLKYNRLHFRKKNVVKPGIES